MQTSINHLLIDAKRRQTNLRHVCSLYVISTHWFLVERNSVVKDGVESITLMMVT